MNTQKRGGFTLIELLVSIAITAVLISIMLPGLSSVRETARRVSCASNQRQLGMTTHMFADDNAELLPATITVSTRAEGVPEGLPSHTTDGVPLTSLIVRFAGKDHLPTTRPTGWDGWGVVYEAGYLTSADVMYCPSHRDGVDLDLFRTRFDDIENGRVIANYEYRGEGPNGLRRLSQIPTSSVFGSDAFGALGWLNHKDGVNSLRMMLSVDWRSRPAEISAEPQAETTALAPEPEDADRVERERERIRDIWRDLDRIDG